MFQITEFSAGWTNLRRASLLSGPAQDISRRGVGWEKGFERKLRQGDVNRRPENRRRADERENALLRSELERHNHAGIFSGAAVLSALAGSRITTEFVKHRSENRVAGHSVLAAQAREQMRTPLGEIGDPWRQPRRMQAEPERVNRRAQQRRIDPGQQRRYRIV